MIGVADSNGIILPFAVYDGERWTAPWPEEDYDVYETMEDIPKSWYSPLENIPKKWNIIYQDNQTGTIEMSKQALVSSWCSQRWVLVGVATRKVHRGNKGDIYDISNSEGLFLATTGNQTESGMKVPDKQSNEYSEIYKLVDASINASEGIGNHPVQESERGAAQTELTTIVRNETHQEGCAIYYVEARKEYPDESSKPWPEGLTVFTAVSYLNGWILRDGNNKLSFIKQDFEIYHRTWLMYTPPDDPLGILTLNGRSYWIIRDWTSYESERWVIFDVSPSDVKQALEVYGGGC
ncbi:MAG: hypothetical protein JW944_12700 [Deltaproteobacteria bacterium]|nr:hypothetical protein [Deltaproteobacteria bacterium]